jgi:DNA polymerase-3 subunit epsilon
MLIHLLTGVAEENVSDIATLLNVNHDVSDALPAWAQELIVFDTETTGIAPETTRIVTANVSRINAVGEVLEAHDWLIDPGIEIPAAATAVHGITTERARSEGTDASTSVSEILETLRAYLDSGIPVVAYNAAYDFTILDREAKRYELAALDSPAPIVDPLIIDRKVDRYRKGKRSLEVTAEFYGVSLTDAHTAAADALAAGHVAQAIARKHAPALTMSALELHLAQVSWAAEQAASFAEYLARQGKKVYPGDGVWPVR